jgi:hypothetical protein
MKNFLRGSKENPELKRPLHDFKTGREYDTQQDRLQCGVPQRAFGGCLGSAVDLSSALLSDPARAVSA